MQGERPRELAGPDVWQTCRELIPAGSVFAFPAEHRDVLFPAGMFADMYLSPNGRPSTPPQVLTVTVVLRALYGLPDHDAALALRCDLRWKGACGLGLLDPGCRLARHVRESRRRDSRIRQSATRIHCRKTGNTNRNIQ